MTPGERRLTCHWCGFRMGSGHADDCPAKPDNVQVPDRTSCRWGPHGFLEVDLDTYHIPEHRQQTRLEWLQLMEELKRGKV